MGDGLVNSLIPEGWANKPSIIAMQTKQSNAIILGKQTVRSEDATVMASELSSPKTVIQELSSPLSGGELSSAKVVGRVGEPRF
jgi:hypothetical protein